jgi:hypothetical protein
MTTFGNTPVPLRPLSDSADSTLGVGVAHQRPGMLTAVCVIAIVLGAMGVGKSVLGLGGLATKKTLENAVKMPRQPGMPDGAVEAQAEMQKKMQAVGDRYLGLNAAIAVLNLLFSACLLGGGIMTLKLNPQARKFLIAAFAAAIVFDVAQTAVTIFVQLQMVTVMSETMPRAMAAATPRGGPPPEELATFTMVLTKVVSFVMIAFYAALGLAEVVFYGVGARYLCRPNVRRLFPQTAADQMGGSFDFPAPLR